MIRRRESRHRVSQNTAARQPQQIERLRANNQRLRRIQPAGNANDHLSESGRAQPLRQTGDLNVIGLVTILLQPRDIRRHERKPLDPPPQPQIVRGGSIRNPIVRQVRGDPAPVGVERTHPQPFLPQQIEVDIGDRRLRLAGKAFGLRQHDAILEHRGLAIPGQIRRQFAAPAAA